MAAARTKQKRTPLPKLSVRPLTPDDWPHIQQLFGRNGACGGCWCMWWRVPRGGKLWEENKGERNKRAFKRLVSAGEATGCLAFAEGEPVGWCSVGPRSVFPRLERTKALATGSDERTWSITCFYIPAKWRHRGVATALLAGAIEVARDGGAKHLEAYPVKSTKGPGQEIPAAFAWTGVPQLFERHRFHDVTPKGNARPIYRRSFRTQRSL